MPDFRPALVRPVAAVLATACLAIVGVRAADVTKPAATKLPPAAASYDFDRDIKPILETNCVRLDTRKGLIEGGEENGKVIVEGHSARSPLIRLVAGLVEDIPMPPAKEN